MLLYCPYCKHETQHVAGRESNYPICTVCHNAHWENGMLTQRSFWGKPDPFPRVDSRSCPLLGLPQGPKRSEGPARLGVTGGSGCQGLGPQKRIVEALCV